MSTVWYSAHRDARGRRFVSRHESDRGETFTRPISESLGGRWAFDWGRPGLGAVHLAIAIIGDVIDEEKGQTGYLWFQFQEEVIEHLPLDGWSMTQEAIWDWILGGITIEALDQAAGKILAKGVS